MEMKNPLNFFESGGQYPPFCQISMCRQITVLCAIGGVNMLRFLHADLPHFGKYDGLFFVENKIPRLLFWHQ
jgi:hypothetical protein